MKATSLKIFFLSQFFILISGVGIVLTAHDSRNTFITLEKTQEERDHLNNQWTQLLLEQSVWARDGRIDQLARQHLSMAPPAANQITMVRP